MFFIFLFGSNDKKEHLDKNDFCHGYNNYFKSAVLKVTCFQGTLTSIFQRYFTVEHFTVMLINSYILLYYTYSYILLLYSYVLLLYYHIIHT